MTTRQQQTPKKYIRITALVSLGTLLCYLGGFAVSGVLSLMRLNHMSEEWPLVEATLIDKTECSDSNSHYYSSFVGGYGGFSSYSGFISGYYLTYNYVTLDGENITATTLYCTSLPTAAATIDSTSSIRYYPDNPTVIFDTLSLSISLVTIGCTMVIVALGLTILACSLNETNEPIYATAVAVPTGDFYADGIMKV